MRCGKYVSRACTLDLAPVQVRDTFGVLPNRASLELFGADDVFPTGSGVGIVPVRSLDGQPGGHAARGAELVISTLAPAAVFAERSVSSPCRTSPCDSSWPF